MKVFCKQVPQMVVLRHLVVTNEHTMLQIVMISSKQLVTRVPKMQWIVLSPRQVEMGFMEVMVWIYQAHQL